MNSPASSLMGRAILSAIAFLLFCVPASAGRLWADEYLDVAREIGDFLVESAQRDGDGAFWGEYVGGTELYKKEHPHKPVSLYTGIAGTGFFLLNLHKMTGDAKYLATAKAAGARLLKLAKPSDTGGVKWEASYEKNGKSRPDGEGVGLYSGNAGIGIFLAHLWKATGEERFRKGTESAFARVLKEATPQKNGCCWVYSLKDIIGGEAGIGLALLDMHGMTKDARYIETARKAARWLLAEAIVDGQKYRWETYGCSDPNFSHGVAGIAFFLSCLKDAEAQKAVTGAATWLESVAQAVGKDGIRWNYYAEPVPEGKENSIMNSWCHGSPGTVLTFLLLQRLTKNDRYIETAKKAGRGLASDLNIGKGEPLFANPTYCCGAGGCIDAFCGLYEASKDKQFLQNAKTLAEAVIKSFRREGKRRLYALYDTEDNETKKTPYFPTGFMTGNAGIGYALLRLSATLEGKQDKLIYLPDQPRGVGAMK